jgi:hypothetical protein
MLALVIGSNSQRLGQHSCQSWEECFEWIDSFITFYGLTKASEFACGDGSLRLWVKETSI